jgi:cytochrome c peroxidase
MPTHLATTPVTPSPRWPRAAALALALVALALQPARAGAVNLAAPPPLSTVPVPTPPGLTTDYVKDLQALQVLGKALFWDMQVGSDGLQACASCHFHAGADRRTKNQVNPGLAGGDASFQLAGPNATLAPAHFPLHRLANPDDRFTVVADANDVVSSQGVRRTRFVTLRQGYPDERGAVVADPIFNVGGANTRRVAGRNAPTVINAVFNLANFWDGRANAIFNGVNPFGDADAGARLMRLDAGGLTPVRVRISSSSLASQAVGPPGNDFEMSWSPRTFPTIGRKLLGLRPLGSQLVHPQDGLLGPHARATLDAQGQVSGERGLATGYGDLIRAAFREAWWASNVLVVFDGGVPQVATYQGRTLTLGANGLVSGMNRPPLVSEFTQLQANFSLFFGLAVQAYEATLVSDDAPFDRFQAGDDRAMSAAAKQGLNLFMTGIQPGIASGGCFNCHGGSEFTNASVSHVGSTRFFGELPERIIERMAMADGGGAFYDAGYYDIGVRPTGSDPGRGATDPFGMPLSFTERARILDNGGTLPFETPPLPCGAGQPSPCFLQRVALDGAFKVPGLRNVELTGPYFHNGGQATLRQVVDFYVRGGDFPERNQATLGPDILTLTGLVGNETAKRQLVEFLKALTDERVRQESGPFDHPELFVPNGSIGDDRALACVWPSCDLLDLIRLPPLGVGGRPAAGLPPLGTFLELDPHDR